MLFAITMIDRPAGAEVRRATAEAHRQYVMAAADRIRVGGPLLADDGEAMIGSLIVADFADRSEAQRFVESEPYNRAGLFETVLIRRFNPVVERGGSGGQREAEGESEA